MLEPYPFFGSLRTDVQFGNGQLGLLAYDGNVTWDVSITCDTDTCYKSAVGNFASGPLTIDVGNYVFSGEITGGTASAWGSSPIEYYQECEDVFINCLSADTEDVYFVGRWNNGWWSEGESYSAYSWDGPLYDWGTLNMTTYTPEPSSMVLVGSGILGLAGVLRRKLLR